MTLSLVRSRLMAFAVLIVFSGSACFAMPDQSKNVQPHKAQVDSQFKSERISKEISLPYLPPMNSGAHFLRGTNFPMAKSGASITMHYTCKESKNDVLSWYRSACDANKWIIDRSSSNQASVSAKKEKYMCQVVVLPPTQKGSKCDFIVRYKFLN